MGDKNLYKIFDQTLQDINKKFISPEVGVGKNYKDSYLDFLDHFRKLLYAKDPVLESYKKTHHVGSNYDNLMVGTTYNEFDTNLLIPMDLNHVKINKTEPGYVTVKFDIPSNMDPKKKITYEKWVDDYGYMKPFKLKTWGQSLIDNCLKESKTLRGEKGVYELERRVSGPAFTIRVKKVNTKIKFDVDVVFCLEFKRLPSCFKTIPGVEEWMAVPKLPKDDKAQKVFKGWRYSFPAAEKKELAGNYHLKSTIRLIKKLRDTNEITFLPSYFIKTIFLWEVKKISPKSWTESLGYLFMTMLDELKLAVDKRVLPYRWDKKMNLFDSLTKGQLQQCSDKLRGIIGDLNKYAKNKVPEKIKLILLNKDEQAMYSVNVEMGVLGDGFFISTENNLNCESSSSRSVSTLRMNQEDEDTDSVLKIAIGIGALAAVIGGGIMLFRNHNRQNHN